MWSRAYSSTCHRVCHNLFRSPRYDHGARSLFRHDVLRPWTFHRNSRRRGESFDWLVQDSAAVQTKSVRFNEPPAETSTPLASFHLRDRRRVYRFLPAGRGRERVTVVRSSGLRIHGFFPTRGERRRRRGHAHRRGRNRGSRSRPRALPKLRVVVILRSVRLIDRLSPAFGEGIFVRGSSRSRGCGRRFSAVVRGVAVDVNSPRAKLRFQERRELFLLRDERRKKGE